ncbi:hypothetical protein C3L33_11311, partial [Rhododendron williamsianum]
MQTSSVILGAKPLPLWSPIVILKSLYTPKTTTTTFSFNDSFSGGVSMAAAPPATATAPKWAQKTITLPPHKRGCHLITPKVFRFFPCFFYVSSFFLSNLNCLSLTGECCTMEAYTRRHVLNPFHFSSSFSFAGPDDMPAHIKSSMFGCTLTCGWIPITNGQLNMGTWQVGQNEV